MSGEFSTGGLGNIQPALTGARYDWLGNPAKKEPEGRDELPLRP